MNNIDKKTLRSLDKGGHTFTSVARLMAKRRFVLMSISQFFLGENLF